MTAFTGKTDLGQGNRTALAQIVAEELDVPFDRVRMIMGDTARSVDQGPTVGSLTIALAGPQLRQAAANGRQALLDLAATKLGVPGDKLTVKDGVVSEVGDRVAAASPTGISSAAGCSASRCPRKVLGPASGSRSAGRSRRLPSEYKVVGQSVPRVDIPPKVTGEWFYIQDVRLPGMLHGRVIRPKGLGSQLLGYGKPSHGAQVVRLKNFLGVVAESEWDAIQAARRPEGALVGLGQAADDGQPLLLHPQHAEHRGRGRREHRRCRARRSPTRRARSAPPTRPRCRRTARSGPRARSPTSRTAQPRSGRERRGRTSSASAVADALDMPARERPRHHLRRLGLLRPQRSRTWPRSTPR